jgi:hypothetical protein
MSTLSLEGLRQAFLDPESRIRLSTDILPENHTEFVTITWQGGFLDGRAIHFNENLNVLVGGRGSGKSTVIESLRYVLGKSALGDDSRKVHDGIVSSVLRSGTRITLLIRTYTPDLREYIVERVVPDPPVVRDRAGAPLPFAPGDVAPNAEVYGQHEIAEIARSPVQVAKLLDRLRPPSQGDETEREATRRELELSRNTISALRQELTDIDERLAQLPRLQERLKRFQEAGVEQKLREAAALTREDAILKAAEERLRDLGRPIEDAAKSYPLDLAFLEAPSLKDLPNRAILESARAALEKLNSAVAGFLTLYRTAIQEAELGLQDARRRWKTEREKSRAAFEAVLRRLQESNVDGQEFLNLRGRIEALIPVSQRRTEVLRQLEREEERRRTLLVRWDAFRTDDFQRLSEAGDRVGRGLARRVKVEIGFSGNREPLLDLLRERVSGRLSESLEILSKLESFSMREFSEALKAGAAALASKYSFPPAQAERLFKAAATLGLELEELQLPHTVELLLNVAEAMEQPSWKPLAALSTGQKATAILLLLFLESRAPLVVDQPEDDLDNRFISDSVVPKIREEKRRRQFVFATHNANLPVLGDSELIVGLTPLGDATSGKVTIDPKHMGSIDNPVIQRLVEELLEGGQEAFEMRRLKYGF